MKNQKLSGGRRGCIYLSRHILSALYGISTPIYTASLNQCCHANESQKCNWRLNRWALGYVEWHLVADWVDMLRKWSSSMLSDFCQPITSGISRCGTCHFCMSTTQVLQCIPILPPTYSLYCFLLSVSSKKTMVDHELRWSTMNYNGQNPWCHLTKHSQRPWPNMVVHGWLWLFVVDHGKSWFLAVFC